MFQNKTQSHSIFLFYCYNVYFFIGIVILCMFCCIVLSIISIFYYSIYVIFSYSAFRLQKCSIKINQSVSQSNWKATRSVLLHFPLIGLKAVGG